MVRFEMTFGSCSGHRKFGIVIFGKSAKVATKVATFQRVATKVATFQVVLNGLYWSVLDDSKYAKLVTISQ